MVYVVDSNRWRALGKSNSDEMLPESHLSSPIQWQFCSQQQWQQLQTEPVGKDVKGGRGQGHESHRHCPLHCVANLWLRRAQDTLDKHQPPCNDPA